MIRAIQKFLEKHGEIVTMVKSITERTERRLEEFTESSRAHHELSRAHYETTERTLADVHETVLSHKIQGEEESKGRILFCTG